MATEFLPSPDLFVFMYIRKEAVLSTQIEGSQASLVDVLDREAGETRRGGDDLKEALNYMTAMRSGLDRLKSLPISTRLICEIHEVLMKGVRGADSNPGKFRRIQNWIGPEGSPIGDATYIPPPPVRVHECMSDLEKFLHDRKRVPVLVKAALAHAQFEAIHPFIDGNGRLGRLLVTFFLTSRGVLRHPTLYLSYYFKKYRQTYYDRLAAVHDRGEIENWIEFFLEGVREVSDEGVGTSKSILELRERHRKLVQKTFRSGAPLSLLDRMLREPVVSVKSASIAIDHSYASTNRIIQKFVDLGILFEATGQSRNRLFRYQPYIDLFGVMKP